MNRIRVCAEAIRLRSAGIDIRIATSDVVSALYRLLTSGFLDSTARPCYFRTLFIIKEIENFPGHANRQKQPLSSCQNSSVPKKSERYRVDLPVVVSTVLSP